MDTIASEVDRIVDACDQIEQAVIGLPTADEWRDALGAVEVGRVRIQKLRNDMLAYARKHHGGAE